MNDAPAADRWAAARRLRQYEAEIRVNLVRIAAVGAFYLVHLLHHFAASGKHAWLGFLGLEGGAWLTPQLHLAVTCIVLAWVMAALVVQQLLQAGLFPRWLMYASTGADLCFLTAILTLSSGAASPLIAGYFLIIIMSGLRFDVRLVRLTTCGAICGYAFLLGAARWPMGLTAINTLPVVPRYQELMVVAALLLAGVVVGQWLWHVRKLVDDLVRSS